MDPVKFGIPWIHLYFMYTHFTFGLVSVTCSRRVEGFRYRILSGLDSTHTHTLLDEALTYKTNKNIINLRYISQFGPACWFFSVGPAIGVICCEWIKRIFVVGFRAPLWLCAFGLSFCFFCAVSALHWNRAAAWFRGEDRGVDATNSKWLPRKTATRMESTHTVRL